MTPKQRAQAWAKEHPEFCGILGDRTRTAKGKYGRLGTKPTTYSFVVSAGKARRFTSEPRDKATGRKSGRFNGVCEVTGKVCHGFTLNWWHVKRPDFGEMIDGNPNRIYAYYYFVADDKVANEMGAMPGMGDSYAELSVRHPEYINRQWPDELIALEPADM